METNWDNLKIEIQEILNLSITHLDALTIENVKFYIDHNEYEMAFEMLLIELMSNNITLPFDRYRCLELGKELKLDVEIVYDLDFWDRFVEYLK